MERKQRLGVADISEADKHFLDKSGATAVLHDVLCKFIENRPDDVVDFLASYYEHLNDRKSRAEKALYHINLSHFSKQSFNSNVINAYECLSNTKGSGTVKILKGVIYMDLLRTLCREFPETTRESLLHKLNYRDYEIVSFATFKSSVLICLVVKEYIETVNNVYRLLVGQPVSQSECVKDDIDARLENALCQALSNRLKDAVNISTSNPSATCIRMLESGQSVAPTRVFLSLSAVDSVVSPGKSMISRDEFINHMSLIILDRIHSVH